MHKLFRIVICGICVAVLSPTVSAGDKALERAQFMLRQLNTQKVDLEKQNASLRSELEVLKKASEKKLKEQKSGNRKLDQDGKKKDRYIAKLEEKLNETRVALHSAERESLQANTNGKSLDTELKQCVSNNHILVQINGRLVDDYNKKGCWDSISQAEPFTGIKQVEVENILQEYRFKNEDLKVEQKTEHEE